MTHKFQKMTDVLLRPVQLDGGLSLNNCVLMAPMTRCMADDKLVPTSPRTMKQC